MATDSPSLKFQSEILRGVEELTEEIEQFKNEQIDLYTSQEPTTVLTDALGNSVVVPTYFELQQQIALAVPGGAGGIASKLAKPVNIGISGAVVGSVAFDGSTDVTIETTIPPASISEDAVIGLDDDLANINNRITSLGVTVTALQNQVTNGIYGRTFVQSTPATVWSVNHMLGKYPAVTVFDSAGTEIECGVEYVDLNNVVITSIYAITGTASFN